MNRTEGFSSLTATHGDAGKVVVEKDLPGQPHRGKVFAAVHSHVDDVARHAGGLCVKLIQEGYTGYLIRTTNDEKSGGQSTAQNILGNEQEHSKVAAAIGCKDVFELYYQNHEMDAISSLDIRGRLIFLFRYLKVDTVISFNPSSPVGENPDHWMTGRAVEEAAWMCGMPNDFHEHIEAGIQAHAVRERYYFHDRPGQAFNRVIDIGSHIDKKIASLVECRSQGGNFGSLLRARLAREGKRLPLLGNDDRTADREYVRQFLLDDEREYARAHDLTYAERFFYVDQRLARSKVDEYVEKNAVPL